MFKERVKKIYIYRQTLWNMAIKQLKAKYSGSLLGISWAIINPLLIMLAITFVFTTIFKTQIKNFPIFVLSGIFPWMFFSSAVSEAACSILSQKNILHQFNLPAEIIPLSTVLSNFMNFLIGWCVMYPVFLFFNPAIISKLPLLIIVLFLNLLFISGLGLILSALNVFFRDIEHLLGVLLMFWFWITPIFYSPDMIPENFRWICGINSMASYVTYYRDVVFNGDIPNLSSLIGVALWAVASMLLGIMVFSRLEAKLLKQV